MVQAGGSGWGPGSRDGLRHAAPRKPSRVVGLGMFLAACGGVTAAASAGAVLSAPSAFAQPAPAVGSRADNGNQWATDSIVGSLVSQSPTVAATPTSTAATTPAATTATPAATAAVAAAGQPVALTPVAGPTSTGVPTPTTAAPLPTGVAGSTGIPSVMLAAYQQAAATTATLDPACHLSWTLLAGIGKVESDHADGGEVTAAGVAEPPILGPLLDGANGTTTIRDTDHGRWDYNTTWDRAVGPMQFIPGSWAVFGVDGDGDGVANPEDIHDADLTAARYLCAGGRDLATAAGLSSAVLSYNHSTAYVALVLSWTTAYESGVSALPNPAPVAPEPNPAPTSGPAPVTTPAPAATPTAHPVGTADAAPSLAPPPTGTPLHPITATPTATARTTSSPAATRATPTPSVRSAPTASRRPTVAPTGTPSASASASATQQPAASPEPTFTPTAPPSPSALPTPPTPTGTSSPSPSPACTPATTGPAPTPTATPTPAPSSTDATPGDPTPVPTVTVTPDPTVTPTPVAAC